MPTLKEAKQTIKEPKPKGIDVKVPDWIEEAKENSTGEFEYKTPSQSPFPVFVMCQPYFVSNDIENNPWIRELKGEDKEIDTERFVGEWWNFYKLVSANSIVYLLPPKKNLQDETFVNSFVFLPHIEERNIIILSNFTAPGREGEEVVAGNFLRKLGYTCVKNPYGFEGYPELKYLGRDNIYFGGYGIRTDIRAHRWIESNYGAKIIPVKETNQKLYHLDCSLFVVDENNVIACTEIIDKDTIKQIEKEADVHSVTLKDCLENACNIVRVGDLIIVASSLQFTKSTDPEYKSEWHKNERIQKICNDLGLECTFLQLEEASKSGAALSCLCTPLNWKT